MIRLRSLLVLLAAAAAVSAQYPARSAETVINNHTLTAQEKLMFLRTYGTPPASGRFWYDSASGLWGVEGSAPYGMLLPGHDYGSLSPRASNGNTGVFINGREINVVEALFYYRLFGTVIPGRYWLNGTTGMLGIEGSPRPVVNLFAAYTQRFGSRGGASSKIGINGYASTDGAGGAVVNDGVNGPVWTPN
jgi:hypothetical protein